MAKDGVDYLTEVQRIRAAILVQWGADKPTDEAGMAIRATVLDELIEAVRAERGEGE